MNVTIVAVGRAKKGPVQTLFDEYRKRLPWRLELIEVEEKRPLDPETLKRREAELLLAKVPERAFMVALDERGKLLDSPDFSAKIETWGEQGGGQIAFLIGGADGHDDSVRNQAKFLLSLGKMTWPHMLVRAMLAEQIYRAWSISAGHPYHRDG